MVYPGKVYRIENILPGKSDLENCIEFLDLCLGITLRPIVLDS